MSLLDAYYPEIEQARHHIESRIRHLEDKLFTNKDVSQQIQHEELQCNIINLYKMMKETADSQHLLHRELNDLKSTTVVDYELEGRIHHLELARRDAEERAITLQRELNAVNSAQQRYTHHSKLYDPMNRFSQLEIDARITMHKAKLQEDSRRMYENKMRNVLSQEQLQLEQLRRDREAFERSYRNLSSGDLAGGAKHSKFYTNSFGGSYYGRSPLQGNPKQGQQPKTDYKQRPEDSYQLSFRKDDSKAQTSPSKIRSPYNDIRSQNKDRSDKKYHYDDAHDEVPMASTHTHFKLADRLNWPESQRQQNGDDSDKYGESDPIRVEDLDHKSKVKGKPKNAFLNKSKSKQQSNSDSLDDDQQLQSSSRQLRRSNYIQRSPDRRGQMKSPQQRINQSFSGKFSNSKSKQKSSSKKRKQVANQTDIRKGVLERIQNRIVNAWAVYEDSTFRNTKHQKDHLFNTYGLEIRLRNEMKDKIETHPLVQRKFGLVVD